MPLLRDHLDNEQLTVMSAAVSLACSALRIDHKDVMSRERLASLILTLAQLAPTDASRLAANAVAAFDRNRCLALEPSDQ